VAGEGDRRAGPEVAEARSSKILGGLGSSRGGRRGVAIAVASTVVVFVAIGVAITQSPGWPEVKATFFDWQEFKDSFPEIARAFLLNVKIFCISEVLILVLALALAVIRSLPGPVFFPLRALAIAYADLFRGIPTILVIAMLGSAHPRSGSRGCRPRRRSGASSRSRSSTPPTYRRSTAPGSSRCTRRRRPPPARSGSRTRRRCGS
jgi:hypothetical protein